MPIDIEQKLQNARSLSEAGQHQDARMSLLEVLQEAPEHQTALIMLGGAYFAMEKYSEAEMVFERLVLMDAGSGEFSIALFNTLWKMERREEALEEIKRFMVHADKESQSETIAQYMSITEKIANGEI
jgi:tetratricopeptide (TPR) repeat protein